MRGWSFFTDLFFLQCENCNILLWKLMSQNEMSLCTYPMLLLMAFFLHNIAGDNSMKEFILGFFSWVWFFLEKWMLPQKIHNIWLINEMPKADERTYSSLTQKITSIELYKFYESSIQINAGDLPATKMTNKLPVRTCRERPTHVGCWRTELITFFNNQNLI